MSTLYLRGTAVVLKGSGTRSGLLIFDASREVTDGADQMTLPVDSEAGGGATSALYALHTAAGSSGVTRSMGTIDGPTSGKLWNPTSPATYMSHLGWITPPLSADVTISGTVTFNIAANESNMSANATIGGSLYRIDSQGLPTLIVRASYSTELGTTSAIRNWTGSPTSTNMKIGDRLLLVLWIDDGSGVTMATGYTVQITTDAAGADGSRIDTSETLSFKEAAPTGTQYYLRSTASDISGAKALSTTQGSGTATAAKSTAAGPITYPGTQWTETAGGTAIEWFTPQLQAVTLSGVVEITLGSTGYLYQYLIVGGDPNDAVVLEVAVCSSTGTLVSVFARSYFYNPADGSTTPVTYYVSGAGVALSDGQRLRFRLYHQDAYYPNTQASGTTRTLRYDGTGSYASLLRFEQTLSEYTPPSSVGPPFTRRDRRIVPLL